jgi:hypothetical protein
LAEGSRVAHLGQVRGAVIGNRGHGSVLILVNGLVAAHPERRSTVE